MRGHVIDPSRSVGELAIEIPGAARIFERLGIEYCCGGKRSLRAACQRKGIEEREVLEALEFSQNLPEATDEHWRHEPVAALIRHIVHHHHQYVRTETPRIQRLLDKTVTAHGDRHPELARIRHSFGAMASELAQHMAKEELILFPAIVRLEMPPGDQAARPAATCYDNFTRPVRMMIAEHELTGRDLDEIRQASDDFTPPPDACPTYRALYRALEEFDADMRRHVHLENNLLFPRALALEQQSSVHAA